MVTISAVKTKKDLKTFEQIPERILPGNPYLVPPFPGSIAKLFRDDAPIKKHGHVYPFLAFKNGEPVGRIVATVNQSHNNHYKDKVGFFGFFDFINDVEVARALFKAAEDALRPHGLTSIRGPYSLTHNDECGLLVEGNDAIPMVMMPYNPSYYRDIYEKLGLPKVHTLYAYYLASSTAVPEKVARVTERVRKRSGVTFRNIELKKLKDELRIIESLYNATLFRNWGFVPITYEELEFAADDLKAIVRPESIIFAEKDGEVIGFSMLIPNINEFLWAAGRKKGLLRILKFIWLLKTKRPQEARLAVLGVKPEYENTGIPGVFYFEAIQRAKGTILGGELSWIDEDNVGMLRALEMLGAHKTKAYEVFEKAL